MKRILIKRGTLLKSQGKRRLSLMKYTSTSKEAERLRALKALKLKWRVA